MEIRRGVYENKELTIGSRAKKFKQEELEAVRAELGRGHSRDMLSGPSLGSIKDQFHQPLPPGSLTGCEPAPTV